jgi:hypothetical protein
MLLDLSEDAVRSRLKRGTLRKEKAQDGTVFVVLSANENTCRPSTNGTQASTNQITDNEQPITSQSTDQASLVEVLHDQMEFLRQQLREEREANRENRRIIAGLVQRVPEIEAPREEAALEPRESPETATEIADNSEGGANAEKPGERRSWLYRFFFGPT